MDSTEIFSLRNIKNRFPSGPIIHLHLSSPQIDIIKFIRDSCDIIEKGIYSGKFHDITINYKQYFHTEGSDMGFLYHSNNLSETIDSIYFDSIYRKDHDLGLDFKGRVGFRKGNIFMKEDASGYVSEIKFELISQNPLWNDLRRKDSVTLPKIFHGINEIDLPHLSHIYKFKMSLRPDSLSRNQRISDLGVCKKIK